MLSQQELSDRAEITDLITRYSSAIDRRAWDDLDALFTEDAVLDYTATGGIRGTLPEHKSYNAQVLTSFAGTQHLMALPVLEIDGDTASARTICFNPMVVDDRHVFFVGLWYLDRLVRTAAGWRFSERVEELSYFHNFARPTGAGS
jgi:ketosteroid isomerase-like protein